jgi:hypothetical protein
MARKSNISSDGPSTADVSASEDVEMQDQETTQLSGLKKLGVSAPPMGSFPLCNGDCRIRETGKRSKANRAVAVLPGHARLHSAKSLQSAPRLSHVQTNAPPGLGHKPQHHSQQRGRRRGARRPEEALGSHEHAQEHHWQETRPPWRVKGRHTLRRMRSRSQH